MSKQLLTEAQIISVAESFSTRDLSKSYDQASTILQECPKLNLNQIQSWCKTLLSEYVQSITTTSINAATVASPTSPPTSSSSLSTPVPPIPHLNDAGNNSDLSTLCKVSMSLIVSTLKVIEPSSKHFTILFQIVRLAFSMPPMVDTSSTTEIMKNEVETITTMAKDIVVSTIVWYKKSKYSESLPLSMVRSIPKLLIALLSTNDVVVHNVGQLAIVWKKGIIGILKMRSVELLSLSEQNTPDVITTTTTSTKPPSSTIQSFCFEVSTMMDSLVSNLFQNLEKGVNQFSKELKKGMPTADHSNLPPAFKLLRFWCTSIIALSKNMPMECSRIFPKYSTTLLNVMALAHPVFGVGGASKLQSSSIKAFLLQTISMVFHILLSSKHVHHKLQVQVLQMLQPQPLSNVNRVDPRDVSRLFLFSEVLVTAKDYNETVRRHIYTMIADDEKKQLGLRTLIKRCYSQIILIDQQVLNLLKRGVRLQGNHIVYNQGNIDVSPSSSSSSPATSSVSMHGVADWENNEPSSLLLKIIVSIVTFIGQSPFLPTTNELSHYMYPLITTYLMDPHPAVVEIGITALSSLVQRYVYSMCNYYIFLDVF